MMKKRWKRGGALLLAFALALSGAGLLRTQAAIAVDVDAECTLTVDVNELYTFVENETGDSKDWQGTTEGLYQEDLPGMKSQVEIRLYKVASIDASGDYTAVNEAFNSLDLAAISSKTTAENWRDLAMAASEIVSDTEDGSLKETEEGLTKTVEADSTEVTFEVTFENLETGLYLVAANPVKTDYYTYTFSPYLVSLPNNYYDAEDPYSSDDWIYDVEMGLKVSQTPRYGDLVIEKNLVTQNVTFGEQATFIFQVDITTLEGETSQRMVALNFDGAGVDTVTVPSIPAGAQVTVTEVYSGAGYELADGISAVQQAPVIVADSEVSVAFTNEPSGSTTGGYGVINSFGLETDNSYNYNANYDTYLPGE